MSTADTDDSVAGMLPRFTPERCRPDQLAVRNEILGTRQLNASYTLVGDDGALEGPFNAMLASPELGRLIQSVGQHLRFRGVLRPELRELAILMVAKQERSEYEWYAHSAVAGSLGLPSELLEDILAGRRPSDMSGDEALVYEMCTTLATGGLSEDLFGRALGEVGLEAIVELVFLVGYYRLLAFSMRAFSVSLPRGAACVFDDEEAPR